MCAYSLTRAQIPRVGTQLRGCRGRTCGERAQRGIVPVPCSSIGVNSMTRRLQIIPEYILLSVLPVRHSQRRMNATHRALAAPPHRLVIAVLTCQNLAAAPMKPGELRRSPPSRLCDPFVLAGMIGCYRSESRIVVCWSLVVELLGGVA